LVTSDVTNAVRKLFLFTEEPLHFEGRDRLGDCSEFLRRITKKGPGNAQTIVIFHNTTAILESRISVASRLWIRPI